MTRWRTVNNRRRNKLRWAVKRRKAEWLILHRVVPELLDRVVRNVLFDAFDRAFGPGKGLAMLSGKVVSGKIFHTGGVVSSQPVRPITPGLHEAVMPFRKEPADD